MTALGLQGLSGKSTVDLAYFCLRRCLISDWRARTLKHSPGKDRLHIYRRACFGGVHRGPRYEPLSRAPFELSGQAMLATDPKPSSPAAGLTCGEYLQTHVQQPSQTASIGGR